MCRVGVLSGWVILRLNFRLRGYVSCQYIYGPSDGEWLYYNFAALSFHTKKLCSRLYSIEIEFPWKLVVDFLYVIIEPFSLSVTVENRYKQKSVEDRQTDGRTERITTPKTALA